MASDQLRRESVTEERDTMVEKDRVPKMATHYEHLSEKAKEEEQHISPRSHEKAHRQPEPSLEEISKLRATAQQNSVEAIRAAEERHEKAKESTKSDAGYVGEKAVESGKGAVGYVGKVKDQAVVAGWGATQYTLEKVAEATKAVAGAGKTVVGYAEEKIAAAKDVVVANEERAVDFAARKKAEAQKASYHEDDKGDWGETIASKEQPEEFFEGGEEQQQGGSILQAIGQTIVEIGQTTKELLVGQFPIGLSERDDEAKFREEHHQYPGPGKTN
ncbi:hypothetical protein DH2020_011816 [Rehmannia glutinosa]|uniref:Uncharacterized protein n=1 Tax=Rehmannia glutinosa TaxID=99300 RepID=A0ABR0XEJ0_REHGL